jgi:hypothetical protein
MCVCACVFLSVLVLCLCLLVFSCSHLRFALPDWRASQRLWCVSCTQSLCLYTESRCLLLLQWRVFLRIALSPSPVLAKKKGRVTEQVMSMCVYIKINIFIKI